MIYICAMCGRKTRPAMFIGNEAIGPKCGKRLIGVKTGKNSRLRFVCKPASRETGSKTLDLFPEIE